MSFLFLEHLRTNFDAASRSDGQAEMWLRAKRLQRPYSFGSIYLGPGLVKRVDHRGDDNLDPPGENQRKPVRGASERRASTDAHKANS